MKLESDLDREQAKELVEYERKIRDPIYNYIGLTQLECFVIDTPSFQRLDRIGQMHSVHKVYPGADYSRKVHSLGAMHLIGKAITRLLYFQDPRIHVLTPSPLFADGHSRVEHPEYGSDPEHYLDSEIEQVSNFLDNLNFLRGIFYEHSAIDDDFLGDLDISQCRTGASFIDDNLVAVYAALVFQTVRLIGLLHDAGHGPFSHKLEHIEGVDFDHEDMTPEVIDKIRAEAIDNMRDADKDDLAIQIFQMLIDFAKTVIKEDPDDLDDLAFLAQLVNSPFDCDMLDYVVRDAYFAGTPEYGQTDAERIIKGFVVHNGNLKVSTSELAAVSNAFESVFDMYKAVYYHKTVRMYDIILDDALREIAGKIERLTEDVDEFVKYDDCRLICRIKTSRQDAYKRCREKYRDFEDRNKPYEEVFYRPRVILLEEFFEEFEGENPSPYVHDRLEGKFEEIEDAADEAGISVEFFPDTILNIRRIGTGIEDLLEWVTLGNLYNPDATTENDAFDSFYDYDPDIRERLIRVKVPVRYYIDRDAAKSDKETFNEIVEDAFDELINDIDWIE